MELRKLRKLKKLKDNSTGFLNTASKSIVF